MFVYTWCDTRGLRGCLQVSSPSSAPKIPLWQVIFGAIIVHKQLSALKDEPREDGVVHCTSLNSAPNAVPL